MRARLLPSSAAVASGLNYIQGRLLARAHRMIGIDIDDGKLSSWHAISVRLDVIDNADGTAIEQAVVCCREVGGTSSFEALGSKNVSSSQSTYCGSGWCRDDYRCRSR